MNHLIRKLSACDLCDVSSLRSLYQNGNKYDYNGISILCSETHKTTPELVRFQLGFPLSMLNIQVKDTVQKIVAADYCQRKLAELIDEVSVERLHNTGKEKYTGKFYIYKPQQKVMLRNVSFIQNDMVNIQFSLRFPVYMMEKRNVVSGKLSVKLIKRELTRVIRDFINTFDTSEYKRAVQLYFRQQEICSLLKEKKIVSFIANGSILPRNDKDQPLKSAIPFQSPPEDEIELCLSDGFHIKGMGIREGVTVITGGGYSGKSTLLDSIQDGIYNHIFGDGREYCITRRNSSRIIAEEGRNISSLDISPFILETPSLRTSSFSSKHASGSTSQAANIMEAVTFGCKTLLIDEDRTATNFMIRDSRMKELIKNDPIVPFTDRVRQLYQEMNISTILVIGGSSEYLELADSVYMMQDFQLKNITATINEHRVHSFSFYIYHDSNPIQWTHQRILNSGMFSCYKYDKASNRIREYLHISNGCIYIGNYVFDSSRLNTIVSQQQLLTIALILRAIIQKKSPVNIVDEARKIYQDIENNGFDSIYTVNFNVGLDLELPAFHDILFALSRIGLVQDYVAEETKLHDYEVFLTSGEIDNSKD